MATLVSGRKNKQRDDSVWTVSNRTEVRAQLIHAPCLLVLVTHRLHWSSW